MSVFIGTRARALRGSRGQSLVEFALAAPVLLLILLIAIDAGRLFFGWVNLQNTARIGANFAGNHPKAWNLVGGNSTHRALYQTQIQDDASAINCTLPDPLPTPTFPGGQDLGDLAVVGFDCEFDALTPFVSAVIGNSVTLSAAAEFPIREAVISGGTTVPPPPTCTVPAIAGDNYLAAATEVEGAGLVPNGTEVSGGGGPNAGKVKNNSIAPAEGSSVPCGITVSYDYFAP